MNLYSDIEQASASYRHRHSETMYDTIGGFLFNNGLLIFGIIFFQRAYKIQKKIKLLKE
jgi:hypothetical protein